ncbi:copper homeostasis protein CutC [Deinococcus marmoris]|uniref:PF03932 family protein CutC n=1 Tax=Deinococcus marmoris TaxID=249408 RepID=A0A1U7P3E1_9DEIO|nr:copper homeostasis protein CutC [Deinococcus marmoris]OLV19691.1 Cytoplasmic copper homeostasis protein cutC [Deinococcus marmoris]
MSLAAGLVTEVCVEGIDAVQAAQDGGADRVELCAGLAEGGLTPSLGTVCGALAVARVPVHVIVRPRGGDFVYSDSEFTSMLDDVQVLKEAGVQGVVFGCLTPEATVDVPRTQALVAQAGPMSVTFHRAFDVAADPVQALEHLISCGIDRVLTSGQQVTALDGVSLLQSLLGQARGRIVVLGCGRIRPDSVAELLAQVPLSEIHFSAQRRVDASAAAQPSRIRFGNDENGGQLRTSAEQVAATITAARSGGYGASLS